MRDGYERRLGRRRTAGSGARFSVRRYSIARRQFVDRERPFNSPVDAPLLHGTQFGPFQIASVARRNHRSKSEFSASLLLGPVCSDGQVVDGDRGLGKWSMVNDQLSFVI